MISVGGTQGMPIFLGEKIGQFPRLFPEIRRSRIAGYVRCAPVCISPAYRPGALVTFIY